jgi:hypothetical protein
MPLHLRILLALSVEATIHRELALLPKGYEFSCLAPSQVYSSSTLPATSDPNFILLLQLEPFYSYTSPITCHHALTVPIDQLSNFPSFPI